MKRKSLDEMMAGMGFATSDIGPNVTELRVIVGHQIDNGLINRSAGTWAPEHGPAGMKLSAEERAAAFLEVESAIEKRMYRQLDFRDETTRANVGDSFLTKWENIIREMPLKGHVMPPTSEPAKNAASIICGHKFVQQTMTEDMQAEFEMFIREVLRTTF